MCGKKICNLEDCVNCNKKINDIVVNDYEILKINKMNLIDYQEQSKRTLSKCETPLLDSLHMVLGLQTEAAEIADAYKRYIAYGKELDPVNVKEELGDIMWYVANLCNLHAWNLEEILETNINKLKIRYPEKFNEKEALNRDLEKERIELEK